MLSAIVAHGGQAAAPHDVWRAWNGDPVLIAGLLLATLAYARGRPPGVLRPRDAWRARAYVAAVVALAVALLSPLDAMAAALASAHMVQHLLLIVVAAPLLALSSPWSRLLRGSPLWLRRMLGRASRRLRSRAALLAPLQHPGLAWGMHVAVIWVWHAAVLYDATLDEPLLHAVEHTLFLLTGFAFWRLVVGSRTPAKVSPGLGIVLLFALTLQSVFLSLLLTFARTPWYRGYATTTLAWSLEPLADQQLAGAIMWVPAGLLYLLPALGLLVTWLRAMEAPE